MEQNTLNTPIDALLERLSAMATMMEMLDENQFKVRAMQAAVRSLEDANFEYLDLAAIAEVQGVGKGILGLIQEFAETGAMKDDVLLQEKVPASVLEMTQLRGLGAKKVRTLWQEVGVLSIDALSEAVNAGKIAQVKGFGAKTAANIAEAIQQYRSAKGQVHLHKAWAESERLCGILSALPKVLHAETVGEAAQGAETVRLLSILVSVELPLPELSAQIQALSEFANFTVIENSAQTSPMLTLQGLTENELPCQLILCTPENEGLVRHIATSSAEYHAAFVKFLTEKSSESSITPDVWADEVRMYSEVGIQIIPPELRINARVWSNDDEVRKIGNRVQELVQAQQIRGMLHVHSTWSDGKHTIRQMAERAQMLGYEYLAICDHSKTAVYAGGLTEERVKAQHEEIDRLNEELRGIAGEGTHPFRILKGIESDILRDGSLDYSDAVLETFEVVVASVHSSFSLDRDTMTDRVCRALEHPATTLLGHPTGRLLLMRKGYELDMEAVLDTAKAHGKALEINASPYRLDLTAEHAALAEAWGVPLAINTDAHNMDDLSNMRYGLQVARRAGLQALSVVNTLSCEELLQRF
ncbi:MAG: DNA polymerase/3'-5' exonuclease PolX [Candidatus Kapaibacterium sp.]|nr:MAG: DNA polymerase/3'-5' exonuclease PolX [Candidatus Kapabacteria bacterium]